jgi:hypothetical protein
MVRGAAAGAQDTTFAGGASETRPPRPTTVTVWTAGAHNQPIATRLGYRYERGLYLVGIQWRRTIAASADESFTLAQTMDLLPVVLSTGMPDYTVKRVRVPCDPGLPMQCKSPETVPLEPRTTYGFGIAPLGFLARWRIGSTLGLQLRASGGLVRFTSPVPDPLACNVNFLADASLLADLRVARHVSLVGGMRLNHISNGGRGKVNPGMDSRMIELGLSVTR